MMVETLRGWTFEQYAIAAAEYRRINGELPAPQEGVREIRYWWKRPYEPGKSPIIIDPIIPETDYANELWEAAIEEELARV